MWHDSRGVSSVEFGIILVLFLQLLVGCFDVGRLFLAEHQLRTLASEAARAALVSMQTNTDHWDAAACTFSGATPSAAMQKVLAMVPGLTQDTLSVSCSAAGAGTTSIKTVTVAVQYGFSPISPIWPGTRTLSETSVISY